MKTLQKCVICILLFFIILLTKLYFKESNNNNNNVNEDEEQIKDLIAKVNLRSTWDTTEEYRITSKLLMPTTSYLAWDVSLVTQCSTQNLHYLINLTEVWQGPISVAVFSKTSDVLLTITRLHRLARCYDAIAQYVTFHMVTFEGNGNIRFRNIGPRDCVGLHEFIEERKNFDLSIPYPVNVMRNVARNGVQTDYMLLIDVDMLPSPDLRAKWLRLDKSSLDRNSVYIVPAFELEPKIPPPPTKPDVIHLVKMGLMRPFYAELCAKCHWCVDYVSWHKLPQTGGLAIGHTATWTDPCEPFYISKTDVPAYDEAFKQYGFNRISQVCELYVAGYKFEVLDNAFLVHIGMKTKENFHSSKDLEQEVNRKKYREFKQRLKYKYPNTTRQC